VTIGRHHHPPVRIAGAGGCDRPGEAAGGRRRSWWRHDLAADSATVRGVAAAGQDEAVNAPPLDTPPGISTLARLSRWSFAYCKSRCSQRACWSTVMP